MKLTEKDKKKFNQWMKDNRKKAIKMGLALSFHFIIGAFFGWFLFFGPLQVDETLLQFLGALILGLINLSLWTRQKIFSIIGRSKEAINLEKKLRLVRNGIVFMILLIVIVQIYLLGVFPPWGEGSETNFNRTLRVLSSNYAETVNWEEMEEDYRPRFENAEYPEEFYPLMEEFLSELDDPGVGILSAYGTSERRWLGVPRKIEGETVVEWLQPGLDIEGLEPGSVILKRDGLSPEEYMEELHPYLIRGSTPQHREYNRYSQLLAMKSEEEVELTYESPEGQIYTEIISWDEQYFDQGRTKGIQGRELSEEVALIDLGTFFPELHPDLLPDFDAILEDYMNREVLVLDLRGNRGGNLQIAELIAARFFDDTLIYGEERYSSRLPHKAWRTYSEHRVEPRGETYEGEVFLLIDNGNMGNVELFIAMFKDSGRGTVIGLPSAGSAGSSLNLRLSSGQINYSFGDFRRTNDKRIFGEGIHPHHEVEWKREHLIKGKDPFLEKIEEVIEE